MNKDILWVEQYRPSTIDDLILPKEKHLIKKSISKKNLEKLFINDFNNALSDFNLKLSSVASNRKDSELLIEMIFQMGLSRVLKFRKLL